MASYRLTSKAEEDLLSIWSYIAEQSPASATKLIRSFHQHFTLLRNTHRSARRGLTSLQDSATFP